MQKSCDECGCEPHVGQMHLQESVYWHHLKSREILLNGPVDCSVVEMVVMQIHNFNKEDNLAEEGFKQAGCTGYKRDPITIFINSPGGNVGDSFAVVSAIEASITPVVTVAVGEAMSGGFLILLAGHTRYAQRYATVMYHELSSGVGGTATEIREYGKYADRLQQRISDYVVYRTEITEEELSACHRQRKEWYMDAEEALERGVVDGIWPPEVYKTPVLREECAACVAAKEDDCDNCDRFVDETDED